MMTATVRGRDQIGSTCDQQIERAASTRLPAVRGGRRVDTPVRTRHLCVYGERLERRLNSLQAILPAARSAGSGGVRSRRKFCQRNRSDGDFLRQVLRIDPLQLDDDRPVDEPSRPP